MTTTTRTRNRNRRRDRREGFTLMEILLVAAILVILASMGTLAYKQIGKGAYGKIAKGEISALVQACELFYNDNQRYPQNLDELYSGAQDGSVGGTATTRYMDPTKGDRVDPWNNPYEYRIDGELEMVVITSRGPDQQVDTADDISNFTK